ncbi:MAG: DUF4126 domain-containing protein [Verrucomicrobia bacterium]|nr:DUF4126 domain-containing protein [Verrucomicrobiota bacterium]
MEAMLGLLIGIGLSAACGFRVFVPLLIMSIAAHSGHLELSAGFQWIGSDVAIAAFALATILEIAAYYVPWLDNALDSIATPAAIIAGTIVTAAMISDMSPFLKWTLAAIAGGGAAGLVQTATVLTRGASTATTGGLANPIFATVELGGALLTSTLAIWVPLVAVVLFLLFAVLVYKKVIPRLSKVRFFK